MEVSDVTAPIYRRYVVSILAAALVLRTLEGRNSDQER
jgi:hypothetical protein